MSPNARTIQLWRRCLRCCRAMDGAMGSYYHGFSREHITAHREEDNPERLEHLLAKGEQNLRFVLRKYRMEEPRRPDALLGETVDAAPRATTRDARRGGGEVGVDGEDGDRTWTPGR
ncbi:unnamed protein product [Laminaria digitata]